MRTRAVTSATAPTELVPHHATWEQLVFQFLVTLAPPRTIALTEHSRRRGVAVVADDAEGYGHVNSACSQWRKGGAEREIYIAPQRIAKWLHRAAIEWKKR